MCTGLSLITEDGAPIFGRTMEFGSDVLEFQLIASPDGKAYKGHTKDGYDGMDWTADHSFVSASPSKFLSPTEGVNDAGLQVGVFFFMPFEKARFQDPDPERLTETISSWQLPSLLLGKASSVEHAKTLLKDTLVVDSVPSPATEGWEFEPLIHFAINDVTGASIVVEYLHGELHIFDNPPGTITNQPEFSWHQQNLKLFTSLPIDQTPPLP